MRFPGHVHLKQLLSRPREAPGTGKKTPPEPQACGVSWLAVVTRCGGLTRAFLKSAGVVPARSDITLSVQRKEIPPPTHKHQVLVCQLQFCLQVQV